MEETKQPPPSNPPKKIQRDIIKLVEDGYNAIGPPSSEIAYIILGNSGVGKTTLAACLAGYPLEVRMVRSERTVDLKDPEAHPELRIVHTAESGTETPVRIIPQNANYSIFDSPGFFHTAYDRELANAFYIQRIFETRTALKLILVVPKSYFDEKANNFIETVKHFCMIFKNKLDKLENCITLVVSKIKIKDSIENVKKELQERINDILKNNEIVQSDVKLCTVLEFLKKSIELFPKPPFPDNYNILNLSDNPILKSLENSGSVFMPEKNSINVVVSKGCKEELVQKLFQERSEALISTINNIAKKIQEICDGIKNSKKKVVKPMGSLNRFLNLFLGATQEPPIEKLLSLNSFLVFNEFLKTVLEDITIEKFCERFESQIDEIFNIFRQFSVTNNEYVNLSKDLQETKQQLKMVEFLDKVFEERIWKELEPYRKAFKNIEETLFEAQKQGINSFEVDQKNENRDYFIEAITMMTTFENQMKANCQNQKALAFYSLSRIDFRRQNYEIALNESMQSFKLNSNYHPLFQLIDELCFEASSLLNLIEKENHVIEQIFLINNQKFIDMIASFEKIFQIFIKEEVYKIEYLMALDRLLTNQRALDSEASIKEMPKLIAIFLDMLDSLNLKDKIDQFQSFVTYIQQIITIYQPNGLNNCQSSFKIWIEKLKLINIENILFNKIQKFSVEALWKVEKEIASYQKLVELTKRVDILSNKQTLASDPTVINVRIEAFDALGELYLLKNEYEESFKYCLIALEEKPDLEKSLRRLDRIYFNQGNNLDFFGRVPANVKEKLLQNNLNEHIRIIKQKFMNIFNDFKTKSMKFFNFYEDWNEFAMIGFLQDLKKIFCIFERISTERNYEHLYQILEILKPQMKESIIIAEMSKIPSSIFEKNFTASKNFICIEGVMNQYAYIEKLTDKNIDIMKKCFEETPGNPFYETKVSNDSLFEQYVSEFPLNNNISTEKYYYDILDLISTVKTNMKCSFLTSEVLFRLGCIKNSIENYEKALNYDEIFLDLCKNDENKRNFYAVNSKKREIYENMAKYYKNENNLMKALEFYEKRGNHFEIRKIFKQIEDKHGETNPEIFEIFADYYRNIGMIDSAVDYYRRATSFIYDLKKLAAIKQKIYESLCSVGPQGSKTLEYLKNKELLEKELEFIEEGVQIFAEKSDWIQLLKKLTI